MSKRYLYLDTETHGAEKMYSMPPEEFFRLGQYAWDDGPVVLTTDIEEIRQAVREADYVVGHNLISYDISYLFGVESLESLQMCLDRKVLDTFVIASLVTPAPYSYTDRKGHTYYDAAAPGTARKYLSLDNLAFQFELPGKVGSLQDLAKKYNPPKTLVANLDYGVIPLDDPEFLEYAEGDIIAVRALWHYLRDRIREQDYNRDYIWRELTIAGINAQITRNGICVDREAAEARVNELAVEREKFMQWLVETYNFPTEGKAPWSTTEGKAVIMRVLAEYGITPETRPDWPCTPTGAPKLGGDELIALTKGTGAEAFGQAMAALKGQRSLAQLALDSTHADGRVHPEITTLQRSGRTSVQKPGLTVWTAKGDGAVEKRYFVADPGHVFLEADYSAADARAVAALSGDAEYAKRLEPGVDPHELTGRIFFGDESYDSNPGEYRQVAKAANHMMSYRVGARKMADSTGVTVAEAKEFLRLYKEAYPWVALWQDMVTQEGEEFGYVTNTWGRRMTVDEGRSFTQSSALHGQSTTREILFDGLIRIVRDAIEHARFIRATIHDAVLFCLPEGRAEELADYVCDRMSTTFDPGTQLSQPIDFTVSRGPLAKNWYEAGH